MSTDDDTECKHGTPGYADCDACAEEYGMEYRVIGNAKILVIKDAKPDDVKEALARREAFARHA